MNAFGFYLTFGFLLLDCKIAASGAVERAEEGDTGNLATFRFNRQSEIPWTSGKEIKISGRLYDVVRLERKSNSVYVTCISDVHEDRVAGELDSFEKSNDNSRSPKKAFLNPVKILKNFLAPEAVKQFNGSGNVEYTSMVTAAYHPPLKEILIPPPKFAS